jgi:cytochrome c oxidase assembly protein subunit 15
LNQNISLDAFKKIFYMEWSHRLLGRAVGIAFIVPLIYFVSRKQLTRTMSAKLFGMSLLIGVQGVLGWYMVKSGLKDSLLDTPGAVPRVSQYRLVAHLGTALALYAGMLGTGLSIIKDWKFLNTGQWAGAAWPSVRFDHMIKLSRYSWALTGLVFLTALSGKICLFVWLSSPNQDCRSIRGRPRCRVAIQRIPSDGWSYGSSP